MSNQHGETGAIEETNTSNNSPLLSSATGLKERLLKELRNERCRDACRRNYPDTLSAWCLICLCHAAADEIEKTSREAAAALPDPLLESLSVEEKKEP